MHVKTSTFKLVFNHFVFKSNSLSIIINMAKCYYFSEKRFLGKREIF